MRYGNAPSSDRTRPQAFEKYQKAVEIKPDDPKVFSNWGIALADMAKGKEGDEAEGLFNQALEKYRKAVELGGSVYNLACFYSRKGLGQKALVLLEQSLRNGEISVGFIVKDQDWIEMKDDLEFLEILDRYGRRDIENSEPSESNFDSIKK